MFISEALPGRNAPPPTTSDEQIQTTGESEALLQSDDSLAVPGREPQDLSDEDAGEEGDIDAIPTQETPEPGEDFDEIVTNSGTEKQKLFWKISPMYAFTAPLSEQILGGAGLSVDQQKELYEHALSLTNYRPE